ncbi:hypothetical protein KAFR_0H02900 [Kazachstania africana CBS 2517]|uniref:SP-RING-type domain-containing protein n=1 Tax=Kazachstania africana (strain ATCC 22294 / BCRC 22015 / CBS 2517 / CECT 1963 / NBRC 1671 / NRRL Y-8276) TaxID=1071382 RepID=H2AZE3_KAZAF|nr:hypothetical protein KAFR_0H02900 [Kazachstania africana CBS 2517]CCF59699.1 hypothetical protein KAFR_0H02900 [Kazachstania africana CBS 2517]
MASGKLLPDSVPLHRHSNKYFHDLHPIDSSLLYSTCEKQFKETIDQIITMSNFLEFETLSNLINQLNDCYQVLMDSQFQAKAQNLSLSESKQKYKIANENCEEVNLKTWSEYASNKLSAPKLSETYKECLQESNNATTSRAPTTSTSKILKILPYILKDPTCIIPDENEDEDDLIINGGQIELICPITCKPFERPMISTKCGHVFDKIGIENYLKGTRDGKRECPQAGCSHTLKMSDFKDDEIMNLRCKISQMIELRDKETDISAENVLDVL